MQPSRGRNLLAALARSVSGAVLMLGGVTLAPAGAVAQAPAAGCSVERETFVSKAVACTLARSSGARAYAFIVHFSGGHDDTKVSIESTLGGEPLACAPGSKTSSFAEDGDIRLVCRFESTAVLDAPLQLRVAIQWYHAWFEGFELTDG